ncbi:MAG: AI-2E family transporter [Candidatus Kapaibacteriales bacterium]
MKEQDPKIHTIAFNSGVILSILALIVFLYLTNQLQNPIVIFLIGLAIAVPFRKESLFVRRIILLLVLFFSIWIFSIIGSSIAPFVVSFAIAYILDPIVDRLEKWKAPRWLISLIIVLLLIGIFGLIFILVAPKIFNQLNEISFKVATIFTTVTGYLETQKISKLLDAIGIQNPYLKNLIETELLPELKFVVTQVINALKSLILGLITMFKQIINAILIPIFSFYFLKDFDKFKNLVVAILEKKNEKFLTDIKRINDIFRVYISWQVFAAFMVGTFCSLSFWIFGVEFSFILGIICGFLNPIPYLGLISSLLISVLTIVLISPENMLHQIIVIVITISAIHFINAYLVEPNVLGKRVGLHPLLLFLSLFIFGGLFGFLGLLFAVPTTAALMLFLKDWTLKNQISVNV